MICLWSMMAWTCHKICLCCKTCYYLEIFLSVATSPVYTNIEMPEKRSTMQSQVGDDWMIPPSCRPQDIHRKRGIGHSECALQVAVSQNMAKYIYIYTMDGILFLFTMTKVRMPQCFFFHQLKLVHHPVTTITRDHHPAPSQKFAALCL